MRVLIVVISLLACHVGAARADVNSEAEAHILKMLKDQDAKIAPSR
jgi:hypothetical protein